MANIKYTIGTGGNYPTINAALLAIVQTDPNQIIGLEIISDITEVASWDFTNTNLKNIEIFDSVYHRGNPNRGHKITNVSFTYTSSLMYTKLKIHDIHVVNSYFQFNGSSDSGHFNSGSSAFYNILMEGSQSYYCVYVETSATNSHDIVKLSNFKIWNFYQYYAAVFIQGESMPYEGWHKKLSIIQNFTISHINSSAYGLALADSRFYDYSFYTSSIYSLKNIILNNCSFQWEYHWQHHPWWPQQNNLYDSTALASTNNSVVDLITHQSTYYSGTIYANVNPSDEFISTNPTNDDFLNLKNTGILYNSGVSGYNPKGIRYNTRPNKNFKYSIGVDQYGDEYKVPEILQSRTLLSWFEFGPF